ncbi:MAG TPA: hypothetical protein VMD53_07455 [Rhizomicrobium sp.]|nr:hypothetical protein [Rhizomicrobium sp.]
MLVPEPMLKWLDVEPLYVLGIVLLTCMFVGATVGFHIRLRLEREPKADVEKKWHHDYDGYIVSAVLGLLALLLGFTFSLAIGRYEERRLLVVEEANAIGTAYLRVQLLGEPHRQRLSGLLIEFTKSEIQMGRLGQGPKTRLLADDRDELTSNLWAATAAAFDSVRTAPLALALVQAMNAVIDDSASHRAARLVHVPTEVFAVLFVYSIGSAIVLGYVLAAGHGRVAAVFLLVLLCLSFLVVVDIDRPASGGIREPQQPMEEALKSMESQPPQTFDRWRVDVLPHQAPVRD